MSASLEGYIFFVHQDITKMVLQNISSVRLLYKSKDITMLGHIYKYNIVPNQLQYNAVSYRK